MTTFRIYRRGPGGGEPAATVTAKDARAALTIFAEEHGLGAVKRDGGGFLYVGDAGSGRFSARGVLCPEELADWERKYTKGQPFGMPEVLAEAIEKAGGLR